MTEILLPLYKLQAVIHSKSQTIAMCVCHPPPRVFITAHFFLYLFFQNGQPSDLAIFIIFFFSFSWKNQVHAHQVSPLLCN